MNIIELHIIQSFPVSCLNRDDVGAPKSAYFGGCQRARVSSQSWKRAIRTMAKDDCSSFTGVRTRYIVEPFEMSLELAGLSADKCKEVAKLVASCLNNDIDKKDPRRVKTALFMSPGEISAISSEIAGIEGEINKAAVSKVCKKARNYDASDITLFGRMVASEPALNLEAAGMFSHALSTHAVANEIDFFAAVDEDSPEDVSGAAITETLEFNSACYYRYIGLNVNLLRDEKHLGHFTGDELDAVLEAFLRASVLAVPQARKNSMFGHNPPAYVLGLQRQGQPLSLVNAFETPVRGSSGLVQPSIEKLEKHWETLKSLYDLKTKKEIKLPPKSLDDMVHGLIEALHNGEAGS